MSKQLNIGNSGRTRLAGITVDPEDRIMPCGNLCLSITKYESKFPFSVENFELFGDQADCIFNYRPRKKHNPILSVYL